MLTTPANPRDPNLPSVEDSALDLVNQMAAEIARPLTSALERVVALSTHGTIDRQGLRALRDELEAARRVGIVGQQITRFASGNVQQTHERLNLTQMLREALSQRSAELQARGLQVHQVLKPAEVIVDASLLFCLLQAVLDWSLEHARTTVDFRLDMKSWPAHARLVCRFGHHPADQAPEAGAAENMRASALDTLLWRLIERIGTTMQLPLTRADSPVETTVTVEFPRTVNESIEGASVIELDQGFSMSSASSALAGSHVLVVAARRDVRTQIRHAIAHMGLVVDYVSSVDAATEFCQEGVPQAVVYESALGGEHFEALRHQLERRATDGVVFIEITEQGHSFEMSTFGGTAAARVGRDAIVSSLPSALMFELAKGY